MPHGRSTLCILLRLQIGLEISAVVLLLVRRKPILSLKLQLQLGLLKLLANVFEFVNEIAAALPFRIDLLITDRHYEIRLPAAKITPNHRGTKLLPRD